MVSPFRVSAGLLCGETHAIDFAPRFCNSDCRLRTLRAHRDKARCLIPPRSGRATIPRKNSIRNGHQFFGTISRGLAQVVEKATKQWGRPNGYILGQEAGGAFVGGLRYGEGIMYTRNAGDLKVYWQGPTLGFDAGADGDRTMMLVYNLPATEAIFQRFRRDGRLRLSGRRLRYDRTGRQ